MSSLSNVTKGPTTRCLSYVSLSFIRNTNYERPPCGHCDAAQCKQALADKENSLELINHLCAQWLRLMTPN